MHIATDFTADTDTNIAAHTFADTAADTATMAHIHANIAAHTTNAATIARAHTAADTTPHCAHCALCWIVVDMRGRLQEGVHHLAAEAR